MCRYLFVRCDNDPAPWTRFVFPNYVIAFMLSNAEMLVAVSGIASEAFPFIIRFLNCSDDHGDRPRPLPSIPELKKATNITERKEGPSWDFDVSILQIHYTRVDIFIYFIEFFL